MLAAAAASFFSLASLTLVEVGFFSFLILLELSETPVVPFASFPTEFGPFYIILRMALNLLVGL